MPSLEEFEQLSHLKKAQKHPEVAKAKRSIEQLEYTAVNSITLALGFVIALTWADTVQLVFQEFLFRAGITGEGVHISILVTILITVFCVIAIVYLPKLVMQKHVDEAGEAVEKQKKKK